MTQIEATALATDPCRETRGAVKVMVVKQVLPATMESVDRTLLIPMRIAMTTMIALMLFVNA